MNNNNKNNRPATTIGRDGLTERHFIFRTGNLLKRKKNQLSPPDTDWK